MDRYVLSLDMKVLPTNAYNTQEIESFASYLVSVPMKVSTTEVIQ